MNQKEKELLVIIFNLILFVKIVFDCLKYGEHRDLHSHSEAEPVDVLDSRSMTSPTVGAVSIVRGIQLRQVLKEYGYEING